MIVQRQYPNKLMHEKIHELLVNGKRLDGRAAFEYRDVKISTNLIEKAAGSALASIGGTKILAGVKIELGTPYPDTPNQANITVNAELLPLAYKTFEPGPPDENAIELARVVDRCIRESKAINLESETLCFIPGQKVAVIYVDVYVLDYDGNYFDPAVLAAVAALSTAKVPRYEVVNGSLRRVEGSYSPLPLRKYPVSVTLGLVVDRLLVDPTAVEEGALDASIVIGWGDDEEICAIQKNTPGLLPLNILEEALEISAKCSKDLRARLLSYLGQQMS